MPRRTSRSRLLLLAAALLAVPTAGGAGPVAQRAGVQGEAPPAAPRLIEAPPAEPRLIEPGGGRLAWSLQGDRVAFDKRGPDGLYDLWTMKPDGGERRCLTCSLHLLRRHHALAPAWHPSGDFILFLAQDRAARLDLGPAELTTPDRGLHSELWAIAAEGGSRIWRLTNSGERGRAVLDGHFSFEGDRLAWSERVASRGGRWGEWTVRVARFSSRAGVPRISRVDSYRPGTPGLIQVLGFTPDDGGLLLAGQLQGQTGFDIYRFELENEELTPITRAPLDWDQEAVQAPRGGPIVWSSGRGLPGYRGLGQRSRAPSARPQPRDLWLLSPGGLEARRLTYFNRPASDAAGPAAAVVDDLAVSPDGRRILLHAVTDLESGEEGIYLLELPAGPGSGGGGGR